MASARNAWTPRVSPAVTTALAALRRRREGRAGVQCEEGQQQRCAVHSDVHSAFATELWNHAFAAVASGASGASGALADVSERPVASTIPTITPTITSTAARGGNVHIHLGELGARGGANMTARVSRCHRRQVPAGCKRIQCMADLKSKLS